MTDPIDLRVLALASVAQRCARETELFFQRQAHDPRYCYELFRQAIVEHHQGAWDLIYAQYCPLVAGQIERHSAFAASGEEIQFFVNRAFEKMWAALGADRFPRFPDLRSLLRYLQMCVYSVILDQVRVAEKSVVTIPVEALIAANDTNGPSSENLAVADVYRWEFWQQIAARLRNEKERRVVYGSYVLALKPREICAPFQDTYRDVKEVYGVKENVLARLQRDAELREILGQDA